MKQWYRELFYVPKHGKIRDKVILTQMVLTVVCMLACIAAMSLTAYAFFSSSVISPANAIKTAGFELSVSASGGGGEVSVTSVGSGTYTAQLSADTDYTVTLTRCGSASTGFCIISAAGCTERYHTCQLGADAGAPGGRRDTYSFTLRVTQDTTVTFLAHWGTSAYYGFTSERYVAGDNANVTVTVISSQPLMGAAGVESEATAPAIPAIEEPADAAEPVELPETAESSADTSSDSENSKELPEL